MQDGVRFVANGTRYQLQKDPNENKAIYFAWGNLGLLKTDGTPDSISSATMSVTDPDGTDVSSTLLSSTTGAITNDNSYFTLAKAGTSGTRYKGIATGVFSSGRERKQVLMITVVTL